MSTLDGLWQPTFAELAGELAPAEFLAQTELELRDGRYWVRFGGEVSDRGLFLIDDAAGPPARLTLRGTNGVNAGRTIPCLFESTATTLTVCYGLDGHCPGSFATAAGTQLYLVRYRRIE